MLLLVVVVPVVTCGAEGVSLRFSFCIYVKDP